MAAYMSYVSATEARLRPYIHITKLASRHQATLARDYPIYTWPKKKKKAARTQLNHMAYRHTAHN